MIVDLFWGIFSKAINWVIQEIAGWLGGPPEWWPSGSHDAFLQGIGYFTYFFNFPALILTLGSVLGLELVFLAIRWSRRSLSLFSGGGGSI